MSKKIIIELSREEAGNLSWLLIEQIKSLKNLQREEMDAMQPIIDDYQSIVDVLLKQLKKNGDGKK